MPTFADHVIAFLQDLVPPEKLPSRVEVMNPYTEKPAWEVTQAFYRKYYSDTKPRILLIGINPGRFGGGITGIPFTDPINLADECQITNGFQRRAELSSRFIYRMIAQLGGVETFYRKFFVTATCPLGFTRDGKNLNYYDLPALQNSWTGFMVSCLQRQMGFNSVPDVAFVLGQGKNYKFLSDLNAKHDFFDELDTLPHPRWVMQYRLKRIDEFIGTYRDKLETAADRFL